MLRDFHTILHLYISCCKPFLLYFCLFSHFIGTFGLFMQNSERRVREFALRLAVGATHRKLLVFVMLESFVVTLLACVPGVLLSMFIYEYTLPEWIGCDA